MELLRCRPPTQRGSGSTFGTSSSRRAAFFASLDLAGSNLPPSKSSSSEMSPVADPLNGDQKLPGPAATSRPGS